MNAEIGQERRIMSGCCDHEGEVFNGMSSAYRRALWAVIIINGGMFGVEMTAGISAQSQALQADALDFLGDFATYFLSMLMIGQPLMWRARAALFKGVSLAAMGLWVFGSTAWHVLVLGVPAAQIMGIVGFMALVANLTSVVLLMRYRDGDANVRSVWLCSRNDAIGNVAVLGAAGLVWWSGTAWPDLLVAFIMAGLFLNSAAQIIRHAREEMAEAAAHA
jgi:Co/Zn/Cd efflux system component